MTHNRDLNAPYNGDRRQADGITVYCSDDGGNVRVFIKKEMPIRQALREVCEEIDGWPETWLIDVISSPTTIWRDLQGQRTMKPTARVQHFGEDSLPYTWVPEISFLGQVGRMDLLRPRRLA